MDWLNYHHLLYFWMVAKEGSVTRACEKLHLSQPTVSNQLKTFEKAIGHVLLQKEGRHLVLTEMGQMVYRFADDIFTTGMDLQHFLAGQSSETRRRHKLAVGITDSFPKLMTYRILEPLLDLQDRLRFVCQEDDNLEGLLARLAAYKLDLVLADAPVPPGTKFKAYNHFLGESGSSFFVVPEQAEVYRRDFPKSLKDAPMLLPSDNTALRRELEEFFSAQGLYPHVVGEFDDMALMKVFGKLGHGIFVLPSVIEEDVCQSFGVEVIGRSDEVRNPFYAITIQRRIRQEEIMRVVNMARENMFKVR